jgi:triosephosphate isomerase
MRQKIVAGNWKMNLKAEDGAGLVSEIQGMYEDEVSREVQLILAPPYPHLMQAVRLTQNHAHIQVAAQNCHQADSGAFTGEVSAEILASFGVKAVILGHSERRQYFGEDAALLTEKLRAALRHGLTPILCCGESLDIREAGTHEAFVWKQLEDVLSKFSEEELASLVLAYEPIWAIGTGKTASAEQAQAMHASIRKNLAAHFSASFAENCSILYGGSCKPSNAAEIFAGADVDGGLIGGASLKSRDFTEIAKAF